MREFIEKALNDYVPAKEQVFAGHPLGAYFRSDIPKLIYNTGLVDRNKYIVSGSVGQGNWATIPWICIFDKTITNSATKGLYIVYLFEKNGNSLYLTFNQGCTDIKQNHSKSETINILRTVADEVKSKIDSRGFNTDNNINLGDNLPDLGVFYEKGTIFYKEYRKGAIPDEEEIRDDLAKMMDIYRDYAKSKKHPVGPFDSWEIIDEKTAIKNCDKSFFEHNGTAIPKEIKWFFGADELLDGTNKSIVLCFNGVNYEGIIRNDTSGMNRSRLFWSKSLGDILQKWQSSNKTTATFLKKDIQTYEVIIKSDDKDMQTKEQIKHIKEYINSKGFCYPDGLIENYYLCLKSKPFVILAGTSGTGKTRLVKLFAEAIGANTENNRYKMVSVRPDWSDSTDLFGHVDLNGNFIPGAIIDFVKSAENDPCHPYFLCLDEMNLARVEYYLSDFLSVIETRDLKDEKIVSDPLVTEKYYGKDQSAAEKYGTIRFPDNLYVIGTVNMDETTFPFSKKVLDRANTIEFSYVEIMPPEEWPDSTIEPLELNNDFLKSNYLFLAQCAYNQESSEAIFDYCKTIDSINKELREANSHIGYRIRDEIVFYLFNNESAKLLSKDEAMDNEIIQKILPRIQGSSKSIEKMLCELFKICADNYEGISTETEISAKMMNVIRNNNSKYKKSAEKIAFMVRRFEEDGFTSYWL